MMATHSTEPACRHEGRRPGTFRIQKLQSAGPRMSRAHIKRRRIERQGPSCRLDGAFPEVSAGGYPANRPRAPGVTARRSATEESGWEFSKYYPAVGGFCRLSLPWHGIGQGSSDFRGSCPLTRTWSTLGRGGPNDVGERERTFWFWR